MEVQDMSKALAGFGATRKLLFSEDGFSFHEIKEIVLIGENAVMFPHLESKENNL